MAPQATETTLEIISTAISFLGPLPTTFKAPRTCGTTTYTWFTGGDTTIWEIAPQTSDDPTCLPPNWVVNGYYSPALCPYGYTNACSMTNTGVETTICCPTNQNFACYSTLAYDRFVCSSFVPPSIMTMGKFAPRDSMSFGAVTHVTHENTRENRHSRSWSDTYFEGSNNVQVYNGIEVHDGVTVSKGITVSNGRTESTAITMSDGITTPNEDTSVPTITPGPHVTTSSANDGTSESTASSLPTPTLASSTSESTTVFTELPGHTLWAYSIQIQKAISTESISLSPSGISTPGSSTTTISSRAGSGLPSAAPPTPSNSTLSVAAYVGIAAGILGALILAAIGTYFFIRGRKGRNVPLSELDGKPVRPFSIHELDEQRNPSEMPAWNEHEPRGPNRQMVWELPA
ncbi:hypothetical protein K449DRAFT_425282 [Hypoxylon sp. EC38]|nr:hypothetical protein K449DRAFT_425282 [Hypoxylon sp. EC38]